MNNLTPDMMLPWETVPAPQDSPGTDTVSDDDKSAEPQNEEVVTRDSAPPEEDKAAAKDGEAKTDSEDEGDDRPKADNDADPEEDDEVEGADEDVEVFEVDGEKISRKEARLGYMRHRDATKKWQEAAEIRKSAEASRGEYVEKLGTLSVALHSLRDDPKLRPLIEAAQKEQEAEFAKLRDAKAAESEEKLREVVPEWVDEDRMESDLKKIIRDTAKTYGFTTDELNLIVDHRAILLMRDAAELQRLKKEQAEVRDKKVKPDSKNVIRPKAKSRRPQNAKAAQHADNMARLRQSGSTEDALAALDSLLSS